MGPAPEGAKPAPLRTVLGPRYLPAGGASDPSGTGAVPTPEVTLRARLVVRITPADVGSRVSVRARVHGAAHGATDTLGHLRAWEGGVLVVERGDGSLVRIAEADLLAARPVPPAPVRRPRGPGR